METYYVDGKGERPSCKVTIRNKPNMQLMAKAFMDLYNTKKISKQLKDEKNQQTIVSQNLHFDSF